MTGYSYQIIIPVSFDYKDEYWQKFACISPVESVLSLKFKERTADRYEVESLTGELGGKAFCVSQSILSIDDDFTKGTIFGSSKDYNGIYGCSMVALYGNLIRRNTIVMHSSLIDVNGDGILFTGPSGTGKTTQAELWQEHRGAEIVNGDMVFIHRDSNGSFYAYGSPWHGSSKYCLNKKLPIKAIIVPVKSEKCLISEIKGMDMLKCVLPEVMLPDWFDGCKDLGISTLDELLKCTPVYRLECTKDIHAVKTVEKELGTSN